MFDDFLTGGLPNDAESVYLTWIDNNSKAVLLNVGGNFFVNMNRKPGRLKLYLKYDLVGCDEPFTNDLSKIL